MRARWRPGAAPQFVQTMPGAAERRHQVARQFDIVKGCVVMDRRVAEQHVDELAGVLPHGRNSERDAHLEQPAGLFLDRLDPADDVRKHAVVIDGRERHFDALLDGNGMRAIRNRSRVAADMIDGLEGNPRSALRAPSGKCS